MNTMEKVLNLFKETNKADITLEKEIGITRGTINNWKNQKNKISVDALHKIADYFGVSVDWLLGRVEEQKLVTNAFDEKHLSDETLKLLKDIKGLNDKQIAYIREMISFYISKLV